MHLIQFNLIHFDVLKKDMHRTRSPLKYVKKQLSQNTVEIQNVTTQKANPLVSINIPYEALLSCLVLSCLVLSCLVLSCLVLSCPVLSCPVLSCPVLSCPVLSCLVLSCLVLSCLVLSCLVLSCWYTGQHSWWSQSNCHSHKTPAVASRFAFYTTISPSRRKNTELGKERVIRPMSITWLTVDARAVNTEC